MLSCRRRSGSSGQTWKQRLAVSRTGRLGAWSVEVHRGWVMSETARATTRWPALDCRRWLRLRTTSATTSISPPSTSRRRCRQVARTTFSQNLDVFCHCQLLLCGISARVHWSQIYVDGPQPLHLPWTRFQSTDDVCNAAAIVRWSVIKPSPVNKTPRVVSPPSAAGGRTPRGIFLKTSSGH